jgi:hypothetical protein
MLLSSLGAMAQGPFTSDRKLYISEGVLRGSPRLLGIAGAYVSVAEGAEGITRNPAAAVSKDPRFLSNLNVDFGAAMHFLAPWSVRAQDWDNDGRRDQVDGGPFNFLGSQVIYLAGSIRYKNVGLGLGADLQNYVTQRFDIAGNEIGGFNVGLVHAFGSLAGSFWQDQILVGLGVESTSAIFAYFENRGLKESLGYHGFGAQFGALWRPKDENYRIGFSFRPQALGHPDTQDRETIGGLTRFANVIAPMRISVGGSVALGSIGRNYNITDKKGWGTKAWNIDGSPVTTAAMRKWLITAQLDVFWSVQNATYLASFFEQGPDVEVRPAGYRVTFEPRLGVEKEVIEEWLRLRGGAYVEPPQVDGGITRPHGTFGFEVRLFRIGDTRIAAGASMDLAWEYQNLSVALMAWK